MFPFSEVGIIIGQAGDEQKSDRPWQLKSEMR
jgi:hypothetical protein